MLTNSQCRISLIASGKECPAFCPVCGSALECVPEPPRKLSTADLDLRGMSRPAPRPEDILAQTRGVK
jgi:hypothetical protein